jgi:hypothetical protein
MKSFALASGILVSSLLAAACSSSDTPATGTNTDGGSGATGTGGKSTGGGGSTGTGGKASGGGGGTGGKSTGGAGGGSSGAGGKATGGSAGDGGPGAGGTDGGGADGGGGRGGAGGAPGDAGNVGCVEYCQLEDSECGFADPVVAPAQFKNNGECMTACAQYPTTGQDGDPTGNTLQCRVTHLNNIVAGQAASLHCPHTGVTPTQYCK